MAENEIDQEVLLWDVEKICKVLSVGRTRFLASEKSGMFGPMPVTNFGRRKLFRADEVKKWIKCDMPSRRNWQIVRGEK